MLYSRQEDVLPHTELLRRGRLVVLDGGRTAVGLCYVDNAVEGMLAAVAHPGTVGQAYNLADATQGSWREYVDALALGLGYRRASLDLPSAAAFPLARLLEAIDGGLRLPGRPLLTRHAVFILSRSQEYPIDKARRDFGFTPRIRLLEGMNRTIDWLNATRG